MLRHSKSAVSWLALAAALVAWFVYLAPPLLGGGTEYVFIRGTSMQPTYRNGDLVLVRQQEDYEVGDVAAFRVPSGDGHAIVIHRIVGELADGTFVLRGDNRDETDPWHPRSTEMVGRPLARIPGIGRAVLQLASNPLLLAALCGLLAGVIVAAGPAPAERATKLT